MVAPALARLEFVDLWLGHDYSEFTQLPGAYAPIHYLVPELEVEAVRVRELCGSLYESTGDSGFTVELTADTLARVTVMHDLRARPVFVLRKLTSEIRPLSKLGLPRLVLEHVLDPDTRGLILICGEQGTGKTTTAASILSGRLHAHAGRALAVEDPPEPKLDGMHGKGRCIQVPVSRRHGSYVEQIRNGMRTGTSLLMIGEIRAADTARAAVQASVNGMTVITTIHGADPLDGIRRLLTWAQASSDGMANAADLLASGLSAVIHQRIQRFDAANGAKARATFSALTISPRDPNQAAIRSKVKSGSFESLAGDIDLQNRRQQWQQ